MAVTAATDPTTSTSLKSTFGIACACPRGITPPIDVLRVRRTTFRGGAACGDPQAAQIAGARRTAAIRRIERGRHWAMPGRILRYEGPDRSAPACSCDKLRHFSLPP